MLTTVKLHDQLRLTAAEVDYVRSDRHLARELNSAEAAISQASPEPALSVRLSPPQPTREVAR